MCGRLLGSLFGFVGLSIAMPINPRKFVLVRKIVADVSTKCLSQRPAKLLCEVLGRRGDNQSIVLGPDLNDPREGIDLSRLFILIFEEILDLVSMRRREPAIYKDKS